MSQYSNEEIVQVTGTVLVDGSATTQPVSGTVAISTMPEVEIKNDTGNPVPISAASLPLPTGASTAANQTTANSSLSSIDGKTPPLGQATMANSSPVVIASNQSAVPVSGTVTANAGTGNFTVVQPTGTNLHTVVDSITGSVAVTGPLTDTQLRATPVPVSFSSGATTPTVTSVSVGTSTTTLAAANSARQKLIIFNESGTLFVKLGTAASGSDYTYRLTANTLLEIDFAQTAAVTAIKASGTSNVQVTSLA